MTGQHPALTQPQQIRADMLCAKALSLHLGLVDAHAARAHQLVGKIAAAITVVGRLVEGEFE